MDWLARLRSLGPDQVFVRHVPMTPRYGRAAQKLRYVLRASTVLGVRATARHGTDAVEIATWAPAPSGPGHGYYACFRIFLEGGRPSSAVLFRFYDGTDKSPGFKSLDSAKAYAAAQGFTEP
jgi:hypothetical protein